MIFLRCVEGCAALDKINNEDIRKQIEIKEKRKRMASETLEKS